jgi:hypothetical protein
MIRLPGLQATSINAAPINPNAVAAPAEALGSVAQAIAGVGEDFHQVAVQTQKLENARILSAKRMELGSEYSKLQLDLENDPDPDSRIARTREFFSGFKGRFDSEELAPAVRNELLNHFDGFASNAVIQQGADSARLAKKRTGLQLTNEHDLAVQRGDKAGAYSVLDRAVEAGVLLPEEAVARKRDVDFKLTYNTFVADIDADPLGAEKMLNDPAFLKNNPLITREAAYSLQRRAEKQANRYRSDFANDIIISGNNPTPEDLAKMEEFGQIDKGTHARWLTNIRTDKPSPVADPAIYEEVYGLIMGYDPAKDPSGRGEAALRNRIASESLPPGDIKVLNEKLSDRIKPDSASKPKNVHEAAFASKIGTDFTRGDFGKYRFPVDHDNDPATAPITPINRDEYDKAWKLRGRFTDQWRATIAGMPEDATFEQVHSAFEALKTSFKDQKPLPDLNFSAPKQLPFDPNAVYQSLPGKRTSFGGASVKPPGISYQGAAATVFGGPRDPDDNGRSAFGGATGEGGKEGTAIPKALLESKFPGKDYDWLSKNVRTVVRGPDGVAHSLPVVDLGTAEWVWARNGRPTLDLTPGAAKQVGGKVIYKNGKLSTVEGLDSLDFSVVSIDTGKVPLEGTSWPDVREAWFKTNKPTSNEQVANSLIALRDTWARAQMNVPQNTKPKTIPLSPPGTRRPASLPDDEDIRVGPSAGDMKTGEFSDYNAR